MSAVVVGTFVFLTQAAGPGDIPREAVDAASAAGCTDVERPVGDAPGGQHLSSGQPFTYEQRPATSGPHDPSPLPTDVHVYEEPVPETQAVHSLEHAAAILYYRSEGDGALPTDVVERLATVAEDSTNVILAPHPNLEDGTALALTAWNRLQTCPSSVTAGQAETIARGFIEAFVCSGNAPEPNASGVC